MATLVKQVHKQWNSEKAEGVSLWFYVGQFASQVGFVAYSWSLGNWVFLCTNIFLMLITLIGFINLRRKRR